MTYRGCLGLVGAALVFLLACGGSDSSGGGPGATGVPIEEAKSTLARDTSPHVAAGDYEALVEGNTALAFDLYGKLASAEKNFFYSPLSVSTALGMTWAGARGQTEAQMAQTLHFTLGQDKLHAALDKLMLDLDGRNVAPHDTTEGSKTIRLQLSNAAWAQKGYDFVAAYLDTLAVNYGAGVKLLDFAADPDGATTTINEWVADQTEDKIQNLIPAGAITSLTRLVLTDTLYFYGNWDRVFTKGLTRDGSFHAPAADVTVPMMNGTPDVGYAEGDGWQMVDVPYDGRGLAMTIVLPAQGRFDEVRGELTAQWLSTSARQLVDQEVSLTLPRFRFAWGSESLRDALISLGMQDAFDANKADFTGMAATGHLYISDVVHKAFVGVDESGTEAAAATGVLVSDTSAPGRTITVDRPFVFFIRDRGTGTLLFVGHVVDPTQS